MSAKPSLAQMINPETREHAETSIKLVFWLFVLMLFSLASKALTSLWLVLQGVDYFGAIPITNVTSFSGLIGPLFVDVIILSTAIVFFRWKKSFAAAGVVLAIAVWRLVNVMMAYFVYDVTSLKITTVLLAIIHVAAAIVGVIATYRLKKLKLQR